MDYDFKSWLRVELSTARLQMLACYELLTPDTYEVLLERVATHPAFFKSLGPNE